MALLAPDATIRTWYRKDSWVYRNFAYIFDNPLWHHSIPKGISVCPYFWMSTVLGLGAMRVLVGIVLLTRFAFKKAGLAKALPATDSWFLSIWDRLGLRVRFPRVPGMPTVMSMMLLFCIAVMVAGVVAAVVLAVVAVHLVHLLPLLAYALGLCAVLVACGRYVERNENRPDRCPVEWYAKGAVVMAIILTVATYWRVVPPATHGIFIGLAWTCHAAANAVVWLGHAVVWLGAKLWLSLEVVGMGIWIGVKAVALMVASLGLMVLVGCVALVGLSLVGLYLDKLFPVKENKPFGVADEEAYRARLAAEAAEQQWADTIRLVLRDDPRVFGISLTEGYYSFRKLSCYGWVSVLRRKFPERLRTSSSEDPSLLSEAARALVRDGYFAWLDEWRIDEAARLAAVQLLQQRQHRRDELCAKCTRVAATILGPVGVGLCAVGRVLAGMYAFLGRLLWRVLKAIWWCFHQSWVFACYLFLFLKSKKQGVCPYYQFVDPAAQPPTPPPSAPTTPTA